MKATKSFKGAVSAVALSAALALQGAVAIQLVAVTAAEAAVVSRIEVRGNQRVGAETIRSYVGIQPGKSFSNDDIDEAVKKLFATGLFSDVRVSQAGSTLVVEVSELSVVNQVLFQGNKKLKDAALAAQVQLKPRGAFSTATMEADADIGPPHRRTEADVRLGFACRRLQRAKIRPASGRGHQRAEIG